MPLQATLVKAGYNASAVGLSGFLDRWTVTDCPDNWEGHGSYTTAQIHAWFDADNSIRQLKPQLILAMVGTVDVRRGKASQGPNDLRNMLTDILGPYCRDQQIKLEQQYLITELAEVGAVGQVEVDAAAGALGGRLLNKPPLPGQIIVVEIGPGGWGGEPAQVRQSGSRQHIADQAASINPDPVAGAGYFALHLLEISHDIR